MGDCRIRIQLSARLQEELLVCKGRKMADGSFSSPLTLVDRKWSADSTLRDILDENVERINGQAPSSLFDLLGSQQAALWNMTSHPPRNITGAALQEFPDRQGKRSQTLQDAGFFPSGFLCLLCPDETPNVPSFGIFENETCQSFQSKNSSAVQWVGPLPPLATNSTESDRLKPSQVLESVHHRFSKEEANDDDSDQAQRLRQENKRSRRQAQQERQARLEARIQKLEEQQSSRNKNVSTQVRNMLIKSRATGRKNLIMTDRLHFKCYCIRDDEDNVSTEQTRDDYRYFSKQDTVGKVVTELLASIASNKGNRGGELLVLCDSKGYRRLPTLMRLYEAMEKGYIEDFSTVVVRILDGTGSEPTLGIECSDQNEEMEIDRTTVITDSEQPPTHDSAEPVDEQQHTDGTMDTSMDTGSSILQLPSLAAAIVEATHAKKKTSKKSASTASTKVRQMQMKSKAKGDGKRIKLSDRFFLELILVKTDGQIESIAPVFVAKSDALERIVRDCCGKAMGQTWEMLVPRPDSAVFEKVLDTSMTFQQACDDNMLLPFGQLVVRRLL